MPGIGIVRSRWRASSRWRGYPGWRWLSHREDTPWDPSIRIFRQRERMVWGPVFEQMAAELRRLMRTPARTPSVTVAIAPDELIDRITMLEVKAEGLTDPLELKNLRRELAALIAARERSLFDPTEVEDLAAELRDVNEALWTTEERIREHEWAGDFGPEFVELARSMSRNNDRREAIERRINEPLSSEARRRGVMDG